MKLDAQDLDTIIAYALSNSRQKTGSAHMIYPLAQLRSMYMEKSIEIASCALARIQYDSLYGH